MGMRAKLRHVSVVELQAAKKEPAKFYREMYGIKAKGSDKNALMQTLGAQLGQALIASPMGKEFTDLPEAHRVVEAARQGRTPDPTDQQVMLQKMMEILPKVNFRPDVSAFSQALPKMTKIPMGLELEKSWHSLHFLLSGKVWETGDDPIEKAILGGVEISDTESVMGYGPVRYLEPGEVEEITAALESYDIERNALNFSPGAASDADIYCPDHSPEELIHYFTVVKNYYREALLKKHAMLIWIE